MAREWNSARSTITCSRISGWRTGVLLDDLLTQVVATIGMCGGSTVSHEARMAQDGMRVRARCGIERPFGVRSAPLRTTCG